MKLLGAKLSDKESMTPMLETIRESIITKQPEMHEFIANALKENLIPSPGEAGKKVIDRSLNHMVLLDAITKGMVAQGVRHFIWTCEGKISGYSL
jgi:hypothetical protein